MKYALHTWTLSLTQLRRLQFPGFRVADDKQPTEPQNEAARTVLAALALYALALQRKRGYWLRSRCELMPEDEADLRILSGASNYVEIIRSHEDVRKTLLKPAIEEAEELGVCWEETVVRLTPTAELKRLVELSDALGPTADDEADGGQATSDADSEG
jgi:CRISPR-associated protein Csb1